MKEIRKIELESLGEVELKTLLEIAVEKLGKKPLTWYSRISALWPDQADKIYKKLGCTKEDLRCSLIEKVVDHIPYAPIMRTEIIQESVTEEEREILLDIGDLRARGYSRGLGLYEPGEQVVKYMVHCVTTPAHATGGTGT